MRATSSQLTLLTFATVEARTFTQGGLCLGNLLFNIIYFFLIGCCEINVFLADADK